MLYADFTERIDRSSTVQIGTITFKKKRAERKFTGQVLWDGIEQNSPIYNYDSIRTEKNSLAVIYLNDGTEIELAEDTLILLNIKKNNLDIKFEQGSIAARTSLENNTSGEISISSEDSVVKLKDGGVNLSKGLDSSVTVDVTNGSASVISDSGEVLVDTGKSAVVASNGETQVKKVSYFLESPVNSKLFFTTKNKKRIRFAWSKTDSLKKSLYISPDYNFQKNVYKVSVGLNYSELEIGSGTYYWRIESSKGISTVKKFSVLLEKSPTQIFPKNKSEISYYSKKPLIKFSWDKARYSTSYEVEVFKDKNLTNKVVSLKSRGTYISTDELGAGKYYWRVKNVYGKNIEDPNIFSTVREFTIKTKENLASPQSNSDSSNASVSTAAVVSGNQILSWKDVPDAESYKVELASDENFNDVIDIKETKYNYYVPPKNLKKGKYYWRITAVSGNASSKPSETNVLTVKGISMLVPIIPENGFIFKSGNTEVELKWKDPNKGKSYFLEIAKDEKFSNIIISEKSNKKRIIIKKMNPGKYYWRVFLLDNNNVRLIGSKVFSFIVPEELEAPVLLKPASSEIVDMLEKDNVYFSWKKVNRATHYKIKCYRVIAGVKQPVFEKTVRTSYYMFKDLKSLNKGSYVWEVQAYQYDGKELTGVGIKAVSAFTLTLSKRVTQPVIVSPSVIYVD